jgi:transcriptional regulator NrdR family protein
MRKKSRRRRCATGKRRFNDKTEADRFIQSVNSGPGLFLIGWKLERSYSCNKCNGWHATSETLEKYEVNLGMAEEMIGNV